MTNHATPSASLAILITVIGLVYFRAFALSTGFSHTHSFLKQSNRGVNYRNKPTTTATLSENRILGIEPTPLCDLQTFLRLCNLVDSGGEAKTVIQDSKCWLNGNVETRRGKKLFVGDKVTYLSAVDLDVATVVEEKGYVYKQKEKKDKPLPKVDEKGAKNGGRNES